MAHEDLQRASESAAAPFVMLEHYLQGVFARLFAWAERFTAGRYWKWKAAALFVPLSLVVACPSFTSVDSGTWADKWDAFLTQAEAPFTPHHYDSDSHFAKLAFRLTVPVVAHVLHLGKGGCIVLMVVCLFGLFYFLAGLAEKALAGRPDAFILTLGACFIFLGNVLVSDMRAVFDVVSFVMMAAAMYTRSSAVLVPMLLLGYFNDERALIASPLILLWHLVEGRSVPILRELFRAPRIAWMVPVSWLIYFALRHLLGTLFGLQIESGGTNLMLEQMNNWMFGLWTGLEGWWLPVLAGFMLLLLQRRFAFTALFAAAMAVVVVVAWSVIDITRSMAYIFPAVFIGLAVVARSETPATMRKLVLLTFLLCLFPTYYADSDRMILYYHTLPLRLLGLFTHGG
jgi:hypothetical protein